MFKVLRKVCVKYKSNPMNHGIVTEKFQYQKA